MDTSFFMNGIIGVINTPFTENNAVDNESLLRYVDEAIRCGVVGLLVPAMAAEVHKLSPGERKSIVKTVAEAVNGRVTVIGSVSAGDQKSRLRFARILNDLGCDGVLVNIPFEAEAQFEQEIREVASLQPGFIMIQDWDFQGYGIPVPTIARLYAEIEAFKCLKIEVVPAGVKYSQVLQATAGKLHVSGGWASSQMIEGLDRGLHAFMPTILHEVYNKIYQLHRHGERERARRLFSELLPILAFSHQHLDISIHFNKRLVYRQGIFSTPRVREPILPFDSYHKRIADELIEKALALSVSLEEF